MAREVIDVGTIANDGTGDTLRACWIKVNNMTDEIYTTFGDGSNLNASVLSTGTPANNQLAIWTNSSTVEGDSNLTWDGSTLGITGDITVSGTVDGVDMADVVTKVGTPADNQIGVWTGDGTIEGDSNLTWDGTDLSVTGTINADDYGDGTDSVPASTVLRGAAKVYSSLAAATNTLETTLNVSSVTDLGIGNHRLNFSNAMSTATYSVQVSSSGPVNVSHTHAFIGNNSRTTTSFAHRQFRDTDSSQGAEGEHLQAAFGDLA